MIQGRGIADYVDLTMIRNRKIVPDEYAASAICIAAEPFACGRWGNSSCRYRRLAGNSLIADDYTPSIDCLNRLFQAHVYAQLQQSNSSRFREILRETCERTLAHVN